MIVVATAFGRTVAVNGTGGAASGQFGVEPEKTIMSLFSNQ